MKAFTTKTLNPSNIATKLALIASGALLATFILAPLGVGASSRDEPVFDNTNTALATFVLQATNGKNFTFELVENGDGQTTLENVTPPVRVIPNAGDDD